MNRQFSEEEIQIANKYTKQWSTSLAIKEINANQISHYQKNKQQQMQPRMKEKNPHALLLEM
jgi:hypothetical protein